MNRPPVCDYDDCDQDAMFFVRVSEDHEVWSGYEFDACSFAHMALPEIADDEPTNPSDKEARG